MTRNRLVIRRRWAVVVAFVILIGGFAALLPLRIVYSESQPTPEAPRAIRQRGGGYRYVPEWLGTVQEAAVPLCFGALFLGFLAQWPIRFERR